MSNSMKAKIIRSGKTLEIIENAGLFLPEKCACKNYKKPTKEANVKHYVKNAN